VTEPIISVSGLRGIVGESLTPEVAMRYVTAFASTLPPGPIIVSRDGRGTGPMLAGAVTSGLLAVGRDVLDARIAATPTLGVLVRSHHAAGGVQISASHNPPQYNGIKLFSGEGRVIPAAPGRLVLDAYRSSQPVWVRHDQVGKLERLVDTTEEHLKRLLVTGAIEAVRSKKYRVLLDSNRGAGSILGVKLLEALGCEVVLLGGDADGKFEHPPEPTAENLQIVTRKVLSARADIGCCQDPDADRLAIIDEAGRYIGEEYTLAICVDHILRQQKGPVVTNCATSRMTQDLAEKHGVPFFRSAVGEANVVDEMLARGAVFGGEGNGGPIDPRVGLVRDSFVGMIQVLGAMASRGKKVSELADELHHYEIRKTTIKLPAAKLSAALKAMQNRFPDAKQDQLDGLRLDWPDRWLIVRGSNTEPIVRAIAEAPTAAAAEELCLAAAQVVAQL
jgi:phosphomannomutase